jgi:ribonuclease HI
MKECRATAFCDGSGGSPRGSTCACVVYDISGEIVAEEARVLALVSNNVAEYEGLILALRTSHDLGVTDLEIFSDSQLIVNQVNGLWKVKHDDLLPLRDLAWEEGLAFNSLSLSWVPREKNTVADALCRVALNEFNPK